MGQQLAV